MSVFILGDNLFIDESRATGTFTLTLSETSASPVTVNYAFVQSTAGNSEFDDFVGVGGTLTFAPGETSRTITFQISGYEGVEGIESFALRLSSPVNASIANDVLWATIVDNDTLVRDTDTSGTLESDERANLSIRDVVVDESAGTATFDLLLDKAATSDFSVSFSTATRAGTATPGADFTATTGTLVFAAGQTSQRISVPVTNDTSAEGDEFFHMSLGALGGAGAGQVQIADGWATALIGRSDGTASSAPTISASNVMVHEGAGYADFVVQLSAPATGVVSVAYAFTGSSAGESVFDDFAALDGTLRFAPGTTTQVVRIELSAYEGLESLESLFMSLSSPVGASIANNVVWATIVDDDTVVSDGNGNGSLEAIERASISVRDVVVDETAGVAVFDLVLDKATTDAFSVAFSTATVAGTATAGSDFTAASGVIGFAPGQTHQTITVSLTDDGAAEEAEFFHLSLGALSGGGAGQVQLGDALGTAIIGRSDGATAGNPFISASHLMVHEGAGFAEFVVTLSAPSSSAVTVGYAFTGSSAGESVFDDFAAVDGTLRFAPGQTTQVVRVDLSAYEGVESAESFFLQLVSPTGASVANNVVWATIVDDDTVVTDTNTSGAIDDSERANLSVRDVVVDESSGIAVFDLVLDKAATAPFTVAYSTATTAGTATAGSDFTAASGTIGFAAGQTHQRVVIDLVDDATAEGMEFFHLTLGAIGGGAAGQVKVADGVGLAVIGRSDGATAATPSISAQHLMVSEGAGYAEFVVQLDAPSAAPVAVNYAFVGSSAGESVFDDFAAIDGTLRFAPGTTVQTVRVDLSAYEGLEDLESFALQLSSPVGAAVQNNVVWATIVDDDRRVTDGDGSGAIDAAEKANLSVRDVVVDEKAGIAYFDLVLDKAPTDAFSVSYSTSTAGMTASAGADFTAASGSIGFAAGQTHQRVAVNIIDDTTAEGPEQFALVLGTLSGSGASQVLVADGRGTATIGRSDGSASAAPVISSSHLMVGEGAGYAEFVVELSAPSTSPVTVNYAFGGGTAGESVFDDFAALDGTLRFAPGQTTQTVRVDLSTYEGLEPLESFYMQLSSPSGGSIANNIVWATIVDDDTVVRDVDSSGAIDPVERARLSVRDVVVDEKAGVAVFDLVLDKATTSPFNVSYSTATNPGTATAGSDFVAASGRIGFAAGQTHQTVTVALRDDALAEGSEYFHLTLGALSGAGVGQVLLADAVGAAVIGRSDQPAAVTPVLSSSRIAVNEADGYAEFVMQLSAPSESVVSVNYAFAGNTASESVFGDFVAVDGTLRFAPGVTTQTVRLDLSSYQGAEPLETLTMTLSSPSGVSLPTTTYTATIYDDDSGFELFAYGLGNDTYTITSTSQYVAEAPGGGIDTVRSFIDYSLQDTDGSGAFGGNVENLVLLGGAVNGIGNADGNAITGNASANLLTGNGGNDTLVGGDGADTLQGGAGNDRLDGGRGGDSMVGAGGDDLYLVNSVSDRTVEVKGNGFDTVNSRVSLSLAPNIEKLVLTGTAALNGTGNAQANTLVGNAAENILNGGGGRDILTGGGGADTFRFSSAVLVSNADTITDFQPGTDRIQLENSVYAQLTTTGVLAAGNFVSSLTGNAVDANDFVLYESDTGRLFFDADGSGDGLKVLIATLSNAPALTALDIFVT